MARIAELEDRRAPRENIDLLQLEANTWNLLQLVLPPRKIEAEPRPTARDLLAENPYTPSATIVQALVESSPLLQELLVVREWLQDTAQLVYFSI